MFLFDLLIDIVFFQIGKFCLKIITLNKFPDKNTTSVKKIFIIYLGAIIFFLIIFFTLSMLNK